MRDAFFRAGVGAIVLDKSRRILTMKRKGTKDGAWQLPQGGIATNETPLDAFYRELNEEVGLARSDIELLSTTKDWLVYEVPVLYRNDKIGWGQAQRWYLCQLLVSPTRVRPDQIEFEAADWVSADQLLKNAIAFRVPLYRRLVSEFSL